MDAKHDEKDNTTDGGNGKDGILVNDQNKKDFGSELINLIKDRKLQLALCQEAIKTCEKYEANTIFDEWEKLLNKVID